MPSDIYATLEQWTSGWRARILQPHTKPYYYVPEPANTLMTKRDLVRAINRAHPGVTYLSVELFNTKAREDKQPPC